MSLDANSIEDAARPGRESRVRRRPLLYDYRRRPWYRKPSVRLAFVAVVAFAAIGAFVFFRGQNAATAEPEVLVAASPLAPGTPATSSPGAASPEPTSADASPVAAGSDTTEATDPASPTPIGQATAPVTPTSTALSEPIVELRPAQVGRGEAMLVRVEAFDAETATIEFEGSSFPLSALSSSPAPDDGLLDPLPEQPAVFWGVVGVPLRAEPHSGTLTVELRTRAGDAIATVSSEYEVVNVARPVDYLALTEELTSVLTPEASAEEARQRTEQFSQFDPLPRWEGLFLRPVGGVVTTQFGQGRSINGGPIGGFHSGTDLALTEGTPVRAAAAARVSWTGEMPIRGFAVILDHGGGVKTGYHHLSAIEVAVGDLVPRGSVIGLVGSTGLSTGPHLHWELTVWGVNVDPLTWTFEAFTP